MNHNRLGYTRGDAPVDEDRYVSHTDNSYDNESDGDYYDEPINGDDNTSEHGDDGGFAAHATENRAHQPPQDEDEGLATGTALQVPEPDAAPVTLPIPSSASTNSSSDVSPTPPFSDGAPSFAQMNCSHSWKYRSLSNAARSVQCRVCKYWMLYFHDYCEKCDMDACDYCRRSDDGFRVGYYIPWANDKVIVLHWAEQGGPPHRLEQREHCRA